MYCRPAHNLVHHTPTCSRHLIPLTFSPASAGMNLYDHFLTLLPTNNPSPTLGLASPDTRDAPLYASDVPGSIFGMMGDDNASDWSLRKLPNLLRQLPESTQKRMIGITTPMVYAGMFGTVFSWHTEDQSLSSLNYLHTGAPKSWYGIKPSDAFRSVSSRLQHSSLSQQQHQTILFHHDHDHGHGHGHGSRSRSRSRVTVTTITITI